MQAVPADTYEPGGFHVIVTLLGVTRFVTGFRVPALLRFIGNPSDSGQERGIVQGRKRKLSPLLPVGSALFFRKGEKITAHRRGELEGAGSAC